MSSVRLVKKMLPDYPQISMEDYESYGYDRASGGWKGINYLKDRGITGALEEGVRYYGKYNVPDPGFPSLEEACAAASSAGGVCVLAHPGNWWSGEAEDMESIFKSLVERGIEGIECYYPSHSAKLTRLCTDFCCKNNLRVTSGGDGHGSFNSVVKGIKYDIGAVKTPLGLLDLRGII